MPTPSKDDNKTRMDNAVREVRRILQKAVDNGQERGLFRMDANRPVPNSPGMLTSWLAKGVIVSKVNGQKPAIERLQEKAGKPVDPDMLPFLGFPEEQHVPGHPEKGNPNGTGWASFYTCIANGKRVYVWAYSDSAGSRDTCCVMVSDNLSDPQRGADMYELQNMFADQHRRQKTRGMMRTHKLPADAFVVQAFIHEVTLAGNEANDWIGVRT